MKRISPWWWLAIGLLAATPLLEPRPAPRGSKLSVVLGPLAAPLAQAQWVLVDAAVREGRLDLALRRADTALALDPRDAQGWMYLAHHLAFERGSIARTSSNAERARWIGAALDVLERGATQVDDPGALALRRAAIWVALAQEPELRPAGTGAPEAWGKAAEAFEAAAAEGYHGAAEAAAAAREHASAPSGDGGDGGGDRHGDRGR